VLGFPKAALQDSLLESALAGPEAVRYVRQLTGLPEPSRLIEIGRYFDRLAKLWFSWKGQNSAQDTQKMAAWFGCYSIVSFVLNAYGDLDGTGAARGVRLEAP
ncbi:MAG: hypothetical protein AABX13_03465, partial [Nanoarchaeota archaeon]